MDAEAGGRRSQIAARDATWLPKEGTTKIGKLINRIESRWKCVFIPSPPGEENRRKIP